MNLMLGSVVWHEVTMAHSRSLCELWRGLDKAGIPFEDYAVVGDALISRARSNLASAFLRSDCDYLLASDADICWEMPDVMRFIDRLENYDFLCAVAPTRGQHSQPAVLLPEGEQVMFSPGAEPVEVPFGSTGFFAVHRRVYEAVARTLPLCHAGSAEPFWPFYMPFVINFNGEDIYLSEDWAFSGPRTPASTSTPTPASGWATRARICSRLRTYTESLVTLIGPLP